MFGLGWTGLVWVNLGILEKGVEVLDFVKVGHLLKVQLTLEQTMKAQRGTRGIALLFL